MSCFDRAPDAALGDGASARATISGTLASIGDGFQSRFAMASVSTACSDRAPVEVLPGDEASTRATMSGTLVTLSGGGSEHGSDASDSFDDSWLGADFEASKRRSRMVVVVRELDRQELSCPVEPEDEGRPFVPPRCSLVLERREPDAEPKGHGAPTGSVRGAAEVGRSDTVSHARKVAL